MLSPFESWKFLYFLDISFVYTSAAGTCYLYQIQIFCNYFNKIIGFLLKARFIDNLTDYLINLELFLQTLKSSVQRR